MLNLPEPHLYASVKYRSEYFSLKELVPPHVYEYYHKKGKDYLLWDMFDPYHLMQNDLIRERYGVMTVNDWPYGGKFTERGFRPSDCHTNSVMSLSGHKFALATDLVPKDVTVQDIFKDMEKDGCFEEGYFDHCEKSIFRFIRRVEWTQGGGKPITWFHHDRKNTGLSYIQRLYL